MSDAGTGYQPTAQEVKALRERTGLPMMECKKALAEAGGDPEKAVEILRQQGAKVSQKKTGRTTAEGRIEVFRTPDNAVVGVAVVLCEQAPTARNEKFVQLVKAFAKQAALLDQEPSVDAVLSAPLPDDGSGRTGKDLLLEVINLIRENMQLAAVDRLKADGGVVGAYVHFNYQEAAIVRLEGKDATGELADEVAANIVAFKPRFATVEEVPEEELEKERRILMEAVRAEGKPEHIAEKIVEGRLRAGFFAENVALQQPYVQNPRQTLGDYLKSKGDVRIATFRRFKIAEIAESVTQA